MGSHVALLLGGKERGGKGGKKGEKLSETWIPPS